MVSLKKHKLHQSLGRKARKRPTHARRRKHPLDGASLFHKAVSVEGLNAGWQRVWRNQGAAGGDGMSVTAFSLGAPERIAALSVALREGSYRPGLLRQVSIPKESGGLRKLTIPCVRDRVAQSAVAQVLTPELDTEMEDASYGYRPGRGVADAVRRVELLRRQGYVWTLDADIDDFFDTIPIDALITRVLRSVSDGPLVELIALWLEQGAVQGRGVAQGSPLSPLLANLYLDTLDEEMSAGGVRIVRYADDFVVLAKDRPAVEAARGRIERLLSDHGLKLDPEKTRIRAYDETLRFLGHAFVRGWAMKHDDEDSDIAAVLRRIGEEDEAEARALAAESNDEKRIGRAGYDRGLRILHVHEAGRRLALRNNSFAVHEVPEEGGEIRELVAIHHTRIDRIEIGSQVKTDIETLKHALACDIPVSFVNGRGETLGHLSVRLSQRAGRHLAQARMISDPAARLDLARRIVVGRLSNQRALLRRVNHRRGLEFVHRSAVMFARLIRRAEFAKSVEELMGHEGAGGKLFWKSWGRLLLHGFSFPGRLRRKAHDAANIGLDLCAWLLARDVGATVVSAGLHPGFGVLHASADGRDACVFDLMEEFRAGMVESVVLAAINKQILRQEMFSVRPDGGLRLGRDGQSALIRAYEERCENTVESLRSGARVTWRRLMREQAESYAAHVEGRAVYRPYVLDH
jgi:CRISPR-associated protein Cas1